MRHFTGNTGYRVRGLDRNGVYSVTIDCRQHVAGGGEPCSRPPASGSGAAIKAAVRSAAPGHAVGEDGGSTTTPLQRWNWPSPTGGAHGAWRGLRQAAAVGFRVAGSDVNAKPSINLR
jgi:hypothetical protein